MSNSLLKSIIWLCNQFLSTFFACADIKYKYGDYAIQKTLSTNRQNANNQENTEQFEGFLNKAINFVIKNLFNE